MSDFTKRFGWLHGMVLVAITASLISGGFTLYRLLFAGGYLSGGLLIAYVYILGACGRMAELWKWER